MAAAQRSSRPRKNGVAPIRIADSIRHSIFAGEFAPGDPLPELHLAHRFKVSQATIRDALSRLVQVGLVRRFQNKGTFVTSLSPKEVTEHLRLRIVLEGVAAADAGQRANDDDFAELERKLSLIGEAMTANDYFRASQADLEFHRHIWRLSGDSTLYKILDQVTVLLFAFVSMRRSRSREELAQVMLSHDPILEALRSRDSEMIRDAIRAHVEQSYMSFLQARAGAFAAAE